MFVFVLRGRGGEGEIIMGSVDMLFWWKCTLLFGGGGCLTLFVWGSAVSFQSSHTIALFYSFSPNHKHKTAEKWNVFNSMQRCTPCHGKTGSCEMHPSQKD